MRTPPGDFRSDAANLKRSTEISGVTGLLARVNDRRLADTLEQLIPGQGLGDRFLDEQRLGRQTGATAPQSHESEKAKPSAAHHLDGTARDAPTKGA